MHKFIVSLSARIISTLCHPMVLLLPVPYAVIFHMTHNISLSLGWMLFSWLFIFAFGTFILWQVRRGKFTNLDVSARKQRPRLFFFIGIAAALYIISLLVLHGPKILIILTIGLLVGLVVLDVINTKVKASIHVASVTSILLAMVIVSGVGFACILLFVPLIAWSRVYLHRHTVTDTVTGAIFGVFLTLVIYAIMELALRY